MTLKLNMKAILEPCLNFTMLEGSFLNNRSKRRLSFSAVYDKIMRTQTILLEQDPEVGNGKDIIFNVECFKKAIKYYPMS